MTPMLLASLVAVFIGVAIASALATTGVLSRSSAGVRRLHAREPVSVGVLERPVQLAETPDPKLSRLSRALPKSAKELGRLRRRLTAAGYDDLSAAVYYSVAKVVLPV